MGSILNQLLYLKLCTLKPSTESDLAGDFDTKLLEWQNSTIWKVCKISYIWCKLDCYTDKQIQGILTKVT